MKTINKDKLANYLIVLFVAIIVYAVARNRYITNKLSGKTQFEKAIITKINSGTGVRQIAGVNYFYFIKGKKYTGSDNGNFNILKTGDTVLIKYSIENNSVSEVANKYYMQKYHKLNKD